MSRTRAPLIAMLAAVASLLPALAAAGAWSPGRGEYYSEISASRGFSDTYYDSAGARFSLPFSERHEVRALSFYNEMGWKRRLSVILAAPITSTTANFPDLRFQQTETGLGDIQLGFKLKVMDGATALAVSAELLAPLGYQTDTAAPLGSGKQLARGRVLFGRSLKRWNSFLEAGGSYLSPFDSGRSQAGGSAQLGIWVRPSILLLGHYRMDRLLGGSESASDDSQIQRVGPELRYRVDDRLDVFAGSNHVASGRGVLHDDSYYFGMAFRKSKHNRLQGLLGNTSQP